MGCLHRIRLGVDGTGSPCTTPYCRTCIVIRGARSPCLGVVRRLGRCHGVAATRGHQLGVGPAPPAKLALRCRRGRRLSSTFAVLRGPPRCSDWLASDDLALLRPPVKQTPGPAATWRVIVTCNCRGGGAPDVDRRSDPMSSCRDLPIGWADVDIVVSVAEPPPATGQQRRPREPGMRVYEPSTLPRYRSRSVTGTTTRRPSRNNRTGKVCFLISS